MVAWKLPEMIVTGKDPSFFTEGISQPENVWYRDWTGNFNVKEGLKVSQIPVAAGLPSHLMVSGSPSTGRVGGRKRRTRTSIHSSRVLPVSVWNAFSEVSR